MKRRIVKCVAGILVLVGFLMLAFAAGTCDYFEEVREAFTFPLKQAVLGIIFMACGAIVLNREEMKHEE